MLGRLATRSAAALLVVLVAGCGGGGDDGHESPSLASPAQFAERVDAPGVVTINVHIPDEGSIAGTDLTIPFDRIANATELPDDLDTPLAVYCRSGNMSADAIDDLVAMGYSDIVELDGGFIAWEASGRVVDPAR